MRAATVDEARDSLSAIVDQVAPFRDVVTVTKLVEPAAGVSRLRHRRYDTAQLKTRMCAGVGVKGHRVRVLILMFSADE